MPTEIKVTMQRFYEEVWNQGNLAAIDELLTPDFVDHGLPPGVPPNREGFKQFAAMYRQAFPDARLTVEDLIIEGDKAVARWSATGTHQGALMGIPATGRKINISGIDVGRFVGGKWAEHWGNFDALGMMQQIGVVPAPGQ